MTSEPKSNYDKLTIREKLFVDHYAVHFSKIAAARAAGYLSEENSNLWTTAEKILARPFVRPALEEIASNIPKPHEILSRLGMLAVQDPRDYMMVVDRPSGKDGATYKALDFDWQKLIDSGAIYSLRSFSLQRGLKIEFEDRIKALELLGKHYGLFKDVIQEGTKGDGTYDELEDAELLKLASNALDTTDQLGHEIDLIEWSNQQVDQINDEHSE